MDRKRLIELAPQYYIIAIYNYFIKEEVFSASTDEIWYKIRGSNRPVFKNALRFLVANKMLDEFVDDFGPTVYQRTPGYSKAFELLSKTPKTPYYNYSLDSDGAAWIRSAMDKLDTALMNEPIEDVDFQNPDLEWEPLPVERDNPKLQIATKKLDEAIAAIDADNGYNATLPEEKAYVAENLKDAANKLKREDTISYAYLKQKVIDPLGSVIRRFGKAAVGLAAKVAKDAILEWLKEIGLNILHWL